MSPRHRPRIRPQVLSMSISHSHVLLNDELLPSLFSGERERKRKINVCFHGDIGDQPSGPEPTLDDLRVPGPSPIVDLGDQPLGPKLSLEDLSTPGPSPIVDIGDQNLV